jgi:hypothetical protein
MAHSYRRPTAPRTALAAAILALAAACGSDEPPTVFDCCANGVYYVCNTRLAYGQCLARPPDTSGCALQANPCPATANQ